MRREKILSFLGEEIFAKKEIVSDRVKKINEISRVKEGDECEIV